MNYCQKCGYEWNGAQKACPKCGWNVDESGDMDEDLLGGALDDTDDEWGEKTVALSPKQMEAAMAASAGRTASGSRGSGAPGRTPFGSVQQGGQNSSSSGAEQLFDIGAGADEAGPGDETVVMTSEQVMAAMEASKNPSSEEGFLQSTTGKIVIGVCVVVVLVLIIAAL